jgi:hypothetical protein
MAITAAEAADWPRIMNTGSMRMLPYAMWVADMATGTSRLFPCPFFGTSEP